METLKIRDITQCMHIHFIRCIFFQIRLHRENQDELGRTQEESGIHVRAGMRGGPALSLSPLQPRVFTVGCSTHIHMYIMLGSLEKETLSVFKCIHSPRTLTISGIIEQGYKYRICHIEQLACMPVLRAAFSSRTNTVSVVEWLSHWKQLSVSIPYGYVTDLLESLSPTYSTHYLFR